MARKARDTTWDSDLLFKNLSRLNMYTLTHKFVFILNDAMTCSVDVANSNTLGDTLAKPEKSA
jgi:hypothetical protein